MFPRYHHVQSMLTQQSSELQDTRMLTEFLERVELEESKELSGSQYSLGQVRKQQTNYSQLTEEVCISRH